MWSQVFVVQPADRMDPPCTSGAIARAVPVARAGWPRAGAWPAAARAPGPKATASPAAPVKTVAARIAFRAVAVLVPVFMNWPFLAPLAVARALAHNGALRRASEPGNPAAELRQSTPRRRQALRSARQARTGKISQFEVSTLSGL
jgi:hypothetical protein